MYKVAARVFAQREMEKQGLIKKGWRFTFDDSKSRLGVCKYKIKTVSISLNYLKVLPKEEVYNTILHEIAHAIVGYGNGHNHIWKQKAIELGCDGNRLYKGEVRIKGKYSLTCPNCGKVSYRHKRPSKGSACGICCKKYSGGKYDSKYKLILSLTEE